MSIRIRPQSTTEQAVGSAAAAAPPRRQRWPLWGAAAGALGFVATLATNPGTDVFSRNGDGVGVIGLLDRTPYHVGVVTGIGVVACLLLLAAGWRRWAEESAPSSLAARAISSALTASAGAMIIGYGMKGSLAVYLPGGFDAGSMPDVGLYPIYAFLDFAPFMAWWGVSMAALLLTWLSLRERRLPVAVGVLAALGWLPPVLFVGATGLPGFPGVVGPAWLLLTSVVLALVRFPGRAR